MVVQYTGQNNNMGVIRPPWITKEWFSTCPFNYCDHFGNKEMLGRLCKICVEEVDIETISSTEDEVIPMNYTHRDIVKDLAKIIARIESEQEIKNTQIKREFISSYTQDEEDLLTIVDLYGKEIQEVIEELMASPLASENTFVINAIDVLSHSRHYIYVKLHRAYSCRYEDIHNINDELKDDKTSAFYAFIATERNSRALIYLAKFKQFTDKKSKYLQLALQSVNICLLIRNTFFPNEQTEFIEFGYNDFEM